MQICGVFSVTSKYGFDTSTGRRELLAISKIADGGG